MGTDGNDYGSVAAVGQPDTFRKVYRDSQCKCRGVLDTRRTGGPVNTGRVKLTNSQGVTVETYLPNVGGLVQYTLIDINLVVGVYIIEPVPCQRK